MESSCVHLTKKGRGCCTRLASDWIPGPQVQSSSWLVSWDSCMAAYLCIPEHSMHSKIPKLMLAHRGSACPQSQHWSLPEMLWTLCRMVSHLPLRSRESVAESILLVEGEAVRSSLWTERERKGVVGQKYLAAEILFHFYIKG